MISGLPDDLHAFWLAFLSEMLDRIKLIRAMYPKAQVYTFHNAGHSPAITREAEYIKLLRDFFSA